jgi:hypothetical protein
MNMSKINKGLIVFIIILTLAIFWRLFTKAPSAQERRVGGLFIEFENGTTEPEVKSIFKNYNMTVNYSIDYNNKDMADMYYITVDRDKIMDLRNELGKVRNWTDPAFPDIKKRNYYIIAVSEQIIYDENFLKTLDKQNLQLKKSVLCYVQFGDGSNSGISEWRANIIKEKLEMNEEVLIVTPDYYK